MQLSIHLVVSGALSAALYAASGSAPLGISSFAAGVFLDVDHVLDYWAEKPFSLDIGDFFRTCEEICLRTARLFFHSLELLAALGALAYLTRSPWLVGLAIGMGQHLAFDQVFNPVRPCAYLFVYRMKNKFRGDAAFTVPASRNR
ncbi:MAG: hypothetical protein ACYC5N_03595 [Endomicrobiales bacterium]